MRIGVASRALGLILVLSAGIVRQAALAETTVVDDKVTVRESGIARPMRGMHMEQVEHSFGAPTTRHAAVGEPPITRWDYPNFAVFFEHDIVIHAVVTGEAGSTGASPPAGSPAPAPSSGSPSPAPASDSPGPAPPSAAPPPTSEASPAAPADAPHPGSKAIERAEGAASTASGAAAPADGAASPTG